MTCAKCQRVFKRNRARGDCKKFYCSNECTRVDKIRGYELTKQEYQEMFCQQGGVCKICREPETRMRNGRTTKLMIDHDHQTGKVRGLLCRHCNVGLGCFKDNPQLILLAARYLHYETMDTESIELMMGW